MKRKTPAEPQLSRGSLKRRCRHQPTPTTPPLFNLFSALPEELSQHVLSNMSLKSLALFSSTSKSFQAYIKDLSTCTKLLIRPINGWIVRKDCEAIRGHFTEIGLFLRSITTLDTITKKLECVEAFLYQLETTYHQLCEKLTLKFAYSCIGLMLYEFIKGWNYRSLSQVFKLIEKLSRLKERVEKVVIEKPDILPHYERDVRQFIREVFLNKCDNKTHLAFWLNQVLTTYSTSQARLLYILYGPVYGTSSPRNGMLNWNLMTCCSSYHTGCHLSQFTELAGILHLLSTQTRFRWNGCVEMFETLTCTPEPWCLENSAKLLFKSGKAVTLCVLKNQLQMRRFEDFSRVSYHLAQVSAENSTLLSHSKLEWFNKMLTESLSTVNSVKIRDQVLEDVFKAWTENIQSLSEELMAPGEDDDLRNELNNSVSNLASLSHLLMSNALSKQPVMLRSMSMNEE